MCIVCVRIYFTTSKRYCRLTGCCLAVFHVKQQTGRFLLSHSRNVGESRLRIAKGREPLTNVMLRITATISAILADNPEVVQEKFERNQWYCGKMNALPRKPLLAQALWCGCGHGQGHQATARQADSSINQARKKFSFGCMCRLLHLIITNKILRPRSSPQNSTNIPAGRTEHCGTVYPILCIHLLLQAGHLSRTLSILLDLSNQAKFEFIDITVS